MRLRCFFPAFVAFLFCQFAQAASNSVTYALKVGDTFKSGDVIDVNDDEDKLAATITYGESGGEDFTAAIADTHLASFPAYTLGNGVNGDKPGGTFYVIQPKYNGKLTVAVVINVGKKFYIQEEGTALEDFNGFTLAEKTFITYTIDVEGSKNYKVYCAGSKLGFYGFKY